MKGLGPATGSLLPWACCSLLACTDEPQAQQPVLRPVRTVEVFATGGARKRAFSGTTDAGTRSEMSFKVSGTVQQVQVKVGDRVDEGQVLVELDDTDYALQVEEARAQLSQARATARNAKAAYDRTRLLYESNNASKSDLDSARAGSETADAQARSAGKALELAKRQLGYTQLRAPFAARVSAVPADDNENVSPGVTVVELTSEGNPEIEFSVPEILISQVSRGAPAEVKLDSMPGKTWKGRVTEIGVAPTQGATTFPVTVEFVEPDDSLRPGLAGEVLLTFGSQDGRERFIVPTVAVGSDHEGPHVFVLQRSDDADRGTVVQRSVQVGELTTDGLEVLSGLEDGDLLVTAGVSILQDGQDVRILPGQ